MSIEGKKSTIKGKEFKLSSYKIDLQNFIWLQCLVVPMDFKGPNLQLGFKIKYILKMYLIIKTNPPTELFLWGMKWLWNRSLFAR
jgi:hypothetical protein